MEDIKESMYILYKAQRDFIKNARHKKMDYDDFLFLQKIHHSCEDLDRINRDFLDKWLKEIDNDAKCKNK